MLEGLVYISAADPDVSQRDIRKILEVSDRNNADAGLTGVLLYTGSMFVQVLEGESEEIDKVMARVEGDRRHDAVTILSREPITRRAFGDWTMAFREIPKDSAEKLYHEIGWDSAIRRLNAIPDNRSMAGMLETINAVVGEFAPGSGDLLGQS